MSNPALIMVRFMGLLVVLTLVGALVSPTAPTSSPYWSSLTDLAVREALAAPPPTCHTVCPHTGNGKKCNTVPPGTFLECVWSGNTCSNVSC